MGTLHLVDYGVKVGYEAGRINIGNDKTDTIFIPIETIDGINVFGKPRITTQCIETCMKNGIPISFFSSAGIYIGGFVPTYINVNRQRKQAYFNITDVSFQLARRIIYSKVYNQLTVLRRYNRTSEGNADEQIKYIRRLQKNIDNCQDIHQLMGYEGICARYYFEGLGKLINPNFAFTKRTKHPAKDPFNSLLSFGYSLLHNEMYGIIASKGLSPYLGFIHEDKENHPALVSDMIEEWRAVIVDSMVMSLINGNEFQMSDFDCSEGYYLCDNARKKFIKKYNEKMETITSYVSDSAHMTYRKAMNYQIQSLAKVIDNNDDQYYRPLLIR